MDSDLYRDVLTVFYPIFFFMSISCQTILGYVIFSYSPQNLRTLKTILGSTCVFQTVLVLVCCLSQFRMISTSVPIELRSYGLCRFLEAWIGYSCYQLLQTSAFLSGMSVIVTFYVKYEAVWSLELSTFKGLKTLVIFYSPIMISLLMEVIMVITQSLPSEIRLHYHTINTNLTEYSVIGALSLKTLPSIINFALISGSVVISPFISFYFRNKILSRINSQLDKSSQVKKSQNRVFVKGLTIQALLPLIFYVPVFGLYFYCILTHAEVLFQQYSMTVVPALPALFDPLLTLYFVTPYRKQVKIWLKITRDSKVIPVVTSQII